MPLADEKSGGLEFGFDSAAFTTALFNTIEVI
jgi:hypothetical protein